MWWSMGWSGPSQWHSEGAQGAERPERQAGGSGKWGYNNNGKMQTGGDNGKNGGDDERAFVR